jgi:peptidyl-prolyl cis-trans isomerase A (cyclophilin A)
MRRARSSLLLLLLAGALGCDRGGGEPGEHEPAAADTPKKSVESSAAKPSEPSPAASDDDNVDIIRAKTKNGDEAAIAVKAPDGWAVVRAPDTPDPHGGKLTLAEATKGLDKKGALAAQIATSMGSIYCDLFEKDAPNTVANFVGLARGKRKFWDAQKLEWTARPYYDGTSFLRVMPGFMIQGGDHTGTGRGGIGYRIADEIKPGQKSDRAGLLQMATRGPGTGEAQFFITTRPAPHIDGKFTIFGQCAPIGVVQAISLVPSSGKPLHTPLTPIAIEKVEVQRVVGGAVKWMPEDVARAAMQGPVPPGRAVQVRNDNSPLPLTEGVPLKAP